MWQKRRRTHELVWLFCDGSAGAFQGKEGLAAPGARYPRAVAPTTKTDTAANGPAECARMMGYCTAAAVAWSVEGVILDWAWRQLPTLTNNEAEYAGLLLGLALAQKLGVEQALCLLDSEVVVGQMEGRFAVHSAQLRTWHWQARAAERMVPCVRYRLIPREWNRLADGLAAQVSVPWSTWRQLLQEGT